MGAWLKVKHAAQYAGISPRTLRDWLKQGLKHSRMPSGTVLIKTESIDEFIQRFEINENQVDRIVDDVLCNL